MDDNDDNNIDFFKLRMTAARLKAKKKQEWMEKIEFVEIDQEEAKKRIDIGTYHHREPEVTFDDWEIIREEFVDNFWYQVGSMIERGDYRVGYIIHPTSPNCEIEGCVKEIEFFYLPN